MRALLIGATGLVGAALLEQLLAASDVSEVRVFHRRPGGPEHEKLTWQVIDFDDVESWADGLAGDVLFSCLGTTRRAAGSKDAQWKVDFTYQLEVARAAAERGVPHLVLVSAAGADPEAFSFYNQLKGTLEHAVTELSFSRVDILQPSLLVGHRAHPRPGEAVGEALLGPITRLSPLKRYRPIPGTTVAAAMLTLARRDEGHRLERYRLDTLFDLAKGA